MFGHGTRRQLVVSQFGVIPRSAGQYFRRSCEKTRDARQRYFAERFEQAMKEQEAGAAQSRSASASKTILVEPLVVERSISKREERR